jgi:actin-related protein
MAAQHTLVLDNGGSTCRLGWAGLDGPTVEAPNAVAHQVSLVSAEVAPAFFDERSSRELMTSYLHL